MDITKVLKSILVHFMPKGARKNCKGAAAPQASMERHPCEQGCQATVQLVVVFKKNEGRERD